MGTGYANICGSLCFIFQRVCQVFLVEKHMKAYSCSIWFYSKDPNPGHRYTQACISLQISCGFGFSIHALGEETLFWFKQTMDNPLPIRQLAAICQRLPHDRS